MEKMNIKENTLNKNFKEPRLRFREFNEPWRIGNFSTLFSYISTNSLSWNNLNYEHGLLRNLHYGIIHSNTNEILSSTILPFINDDLIPKKYTNAIFGDLFLADTSEDRKACGKGIEIKDLHNQDVIGGLHTIHIRDKNSLFVPFFKALFTRSNTYHKFAYKYSEGIKVFSLKPSLFKFLDFYYPEKVEQQKIVDLFIQINNKITLIEQKYKALKKYKKGMIDWWFNKKKECSQLKDVVKPISSHLLTHQIANNNGVYPVYDATGGIYKHVDFFNNEYNAIAIIKYGSGCGRTFMIHGEHSVLGTMTELIPVNEDDLYYIYSYTESANFKKICKKYIEIGTTPNLYYSDYSQAKLYYPKNKKCFSQCTQTFIELEKQLKLKLLLLYKLKKYLLKNLFI